MFRRIKQAQPEPRFEHAADGGVNFRFRDQALFDRAQQRIVIRAAAEVAAGLDRERRGGFRRGREFVIGENVVNRAAIGNDVAVETPLPAQQVRKQQRIRAGRLAINGVVGAHHRADMAFAHGGLKMRQVGFVKIAFGRLGIERVPLRFRPAVDGKMFRAGHRLDVIRIVALQVRE